MSYPQAPTRTALAQHTVSDRPIHGGPEPVRALGGDVDYVHLDWCEGADVLRYMREELRLDHVGAPDEIHPEPLASLTFRATREAAATGWLRLWWD